MTLRIGWLTPFTNRTGVGTFSKAVTDAMPATHGGRAIDLTVIAPLADGLYRTRHRFIDIATTSADSRFYDLFDVLVFNVGNNEEHHKGLFEVLRNVPGIVVCHDYVYQHFLAKMVQDQGSGFSDYVALLARYGTPGALRRVRQSNITRARGLFYAVWDSDFSTEEPLGAPLFQLGSALVVHSGYAARYAAARFDGPLLRLGMPYDQRPAAPEAREPRPAGKRRTVVSFGHVQSTKCIDDVLSAIADSPRLRGEILYVISGFSGSADYLERLCGLIRTHALDACVRFALDLSDAQLEELGAEADAFINLRFPNTEGASVSLIEQLATGKPVVVFDTGCYAEIPDDAAIKVGRPRDIGAIGEAMHRLLGDRDALAAIGARGRAHARRSDCAGYASALLDFIGREAPLLRRRASARARCLIETEAPETGGAEADEAWAETLATARTTFDLLDQGRLALDPSLIRGLGPEKIVDYVQAAILRNGTNLRLTVALQAYLGAAPEAYRPARILQVVREAAILADPEALACLPDLCPHGDLAFWEVVGALGPDALAQVAHHAFFGSPAPAPPDAAAFDAPGDGLLRRLRLADALEGRGGQGLKAPAADRDAVTAWLRQAVAWDAEFLLEPIAVGDSVTMGASDQGRYLRLFGFSGAETSHAWTGPELGLLYVSPARGARRIVLSGHTLDEAVSVTITAALRSEIHEARATPRPDRRAFEIALPDIPESLPESLPESPPAPPLCLSIRSTGCVAPADRGVSGDTRLLGFCLQQIAVH